MQREIWPTEDFEAALSYVPVTPVEDDLFAGLGSCARRPRAGDQRRAQIAYDGTE